jgi:hypothetical protein
VSSQLMPVAEHRPLDRPVANCRIYERKPCDLPTTCRPASAMEMKETGWEATVVDISLGGLRINLRRRFEKGTGLAIELRGDDEQERTVVFVKVVHLQAIENGAWALGCRFISELGEDELQRLLTSTHNVLSSLNNQQLDEKEDDKDEEPGATCSSGAIPPSQPEIRVLTDVHLLAAAQPGSFRECLVKRLNVTKCWPLTAGKILSLRGKTSDHAPWALRIQVLKCNPQGKGWEIQGRIVGPIKGASNGHAPGRP